MGAHAHYSPSSFDRVIECPGSLRESVGMPNRSSKYADEGTIAHKMAAWALEGPAIVAGDWPEATEGMVENVTVYVDHVRGLCVEDNDVLLIEQRVRLTDEMWGTADAIVWSPRTAALFVRDLKYGAGISVEVENNTQLKIYALMALLTFKYPAKTVDIGIVQPRCFHEDGPIRTVTHQAIDLLDFWQEVVDAVAASKLPDAPLHAGSHCRFCPAAPQCPEIKVQAQIAAKAIFAVGKGYEPADLAKTLDQLPLLEAWIKNVREFAYAEAERGHVAPGYKLVAKNAVRRWRDDVQPTDLASQLGATLDDLYEEPKLLGVVEIQKLAPGKNERERAAFIEPFVSKISSGHSLVHVDDKRPAIRVDAKAAFADAPLLTIWPHHGK